MNKATRCTYWFLILAMIMLSAASCSDSKNAPIQTNLPTTGKSITPTNPQIFQQNTPSATYMPTLGIVDTSTSVLSSITPTSSIYTSTSLPVTRSISYIDGWIAFSSMSASPINSGIYLIRPDGSGLKPVIQGNGYFYQSPSWSPDGQWLIFTAEHTGTDHRMGGISQIFIVRPNGTGLRQITFDSVPKYGPEWSPNGQEIVFEEMKVDSAGEFLPDTDLFLVDIAGKEFKRLTDSPTSDGRPSWSSDGKKIAFVRSFNGDWKEGSDIFIMDSDGSNLQKISIPLDSAKGRVGDFAWAPDGKQFLIITGFDCSFYIVNMDGSNLISLNENQLHFTALNWSPDGKYIAYNAAQRCDASADAWDLYTMNANGSNKTLILSRSNGIAPLNPAWSPVPSLQVGATYTITELGDNLKLRDTPTLKGTEVKKLKPGDTVTILDGPAQADDYYWFKMRTSDGTQGWAVDVFGWYQKQ